MSNTQTGYFRLRIFNKYTDKCVLDSKGDTLTLTKDDIQKVLEDSITDFSKIDSNFSSTFTDSKVFFTKDLDSFYITVKFIPKNDK